MNNTQRKTISELSCEKLEAEITFNYKKLQATGKHLKSIRISISKKLQALLDEKQKRMLTK